MPAYIDVIITTSRDYEEEVGFIPIYRPHGESNGWDVEAGQSLMH
jgi:hypothetical protein